MFRPLGGVIKNVPSVLQVKAMVPHASADAMAALLSALDAPLPFRQRAAETVRQSAPAR